jgi:F-type H+-transporting ATPase subunit delta
MADNNTIARPYARAAFAVARQDNAVAELAASLDVGRELLADGRVEKFLSRPALTDAQRLDFLTGLFAGAAGESSVFAGGSQHGINFLKLLIEYDRVDVLPEIADHFDALKAELENSVDVTIISAAPISSEQQQAVATALRERLGHDVILSTEIDENLIGGAVIRAGDVVIDGSLRARLEGLANALTA